jgi:hypothetical protein
MAAQIDPLLLRIPRTLEAERALRCASWTWFRSHSYEDWMERYGDLGKSFGMKVPDHRFGEAGRLWRAWVFHPLWRFAWADHEELAYLKHTQLELEGAREAVRQGSWRQLETHLATMERNFRPPTAAWRFHGGLPLRDDVFAVIGSGPQPPACRYPNYRRAWQITFKNLTLQELVMTAIALKRHELRQGRLPTALAALVPEFLPRVPCDFMDGQPLRYRLNRDGTFLLYSVGANGRDDGGDAVPDVSGTPVDPWNGRDWVWPRLAAGRLDGKLTAGLHKPRSRLD